MRMKFLLQNKSVLNITLKGVQSVALKAIYVKQHEFHVGCCLFYKTHTPTGPGFLKRHSTGAAVLTSLTYSASKLMEQYYFMTADYRSI